VTQRTDKTHLPARLPVTGADVRHTDHATITLRGWHRVVMSTEGEPRAMRNVAADLTAEEVGDRVRTALGDRTEQVEEVAIISETGYEELAEPIRERLGMTPGQMNALVRVTIRDPARSIPSKEANALARQVYRALNQESRGYL
jgi:hypothetical protein